MRRIYDGFTLVELILVMALIGILAVIGIGSYTVATTKSLDTRRKNDLNQIAKALELYNNDMGSYPSVDDDGNMLCPSKNGLTACVDGIYSYINGYEVVYMEDFPTDPDSSKEYVYEPVSEESGFELYTALENSEDRDVVTDTDGVKTVWSQFCGEGINCNYKITETGLVKTRDAASESH